MFALVCSAQAIGYEQFNHDFLDKRVLAINLFTALSEFSRMHCGAICAVLIPCVLLVAIYTLVLLYWQKPIATLCTTATVGTGLAMILFLHVSTWFMIGVVTPVTFILAALGLTCVVSNWAAVGWGWWRSHHRQTPNLV